MYFLCFAISAIFACFLHLACQGKEADIVFIVDMSSSILEDDFEEQLHFLSDLVRNFDIDSGKARVSSLGNNTVS